MHLVTMIVCTQATWTLYLQPSNLFLFTLSFMPSLNCDKYIHTPCTHPCMYMCTMLYIYLYTINIYTSMYPLMSKILVQDTFTGGCWLIGHEYDQRNYFHITILRHTIATLSSITLTLHWVMVLIYILCLCLFTFDAIIKFCSLGAF